MTIIGTSARSRAILLLLFETVQIPERAREDQAARNKGPRPGEKLSRRLARLKLPALASDERFQRLLFRNVVGYNKNNRCTIQVRLVKFLAKRQRYVCGVFIKNSCGRSRSHIPPLKDFFLSPVISP